MIKARRSKAEDDRFRNYARGDKSILWATELFGDWDYLLYVLNHSQEEIHAIVKGMQKAFPDYFISYELLFAFQEHKYAFMTEAMRKRE